MQYRILYDFAINTGKFYDQHCQMASEVATHRVWELHVRVNLLPAYRRELHEPYEGMSIAEIALCATELQHYYSQHVGEINDLT
jgi:hypothetical protein